MKAPNFRLSKSRLTLPISIMILLGVFFVGYYFYYLPVNKADINKNGFLILANIKKSIQEKNQAQEMIYGSYLKSGGNPKDTQQIINGIQKLLDTNKVEGKVFNINHSSSILKGGALSDSFIHSNGDNDVMLKEIINGNLIYKSNNYNTDLGIAKPFESIVQSILQPQKTELFESYLVIDKNGFVYKDPELSFGGKVLADSLLSFDKTARYAGVRDITIEETGYKMFSYPFKIDNIEVVLCGLLKTKQYDEQLHEIPVSFIYPIVILVLLLIIFLPIIKFYIIGPDEHVKFTDIALGALSFFIGGTFITLILIQVLMLWAAGIRTEENLHSLSAQIDSSFREELTVAYGQLDTLDGFVNKKFNSDSLKKFEKGDYRDVSDSIGIYFSTHKNDAALYYGFDRVAWIDSSGQQIIKGQVEGKSSFLNVSERKYFETLKNNEGYMLPGHPGSTFALEPVYNWINGEFRIVVSKKSRLPGDYYTTLSAQMSSVTGTILPPGYGFCIIDNAGDVQVHSEMNRNLRENLIDKIAPSRQIKEAIASRQENYFSNLKFYGKTNAVNIEPISKTPFYLITFYDKGYIVPINMRVFTFALLFCFFTFLICTLIWFLAFRKNYYSYPMLYSPMVFLKWAIPVKSGVQFYVLGVRLLTVYVVLLLLFMLLSTNLGINNYVILVLVLLFPFNIISGLFVLSYSIARHTGAAQKIKHRSKQALTAIIFQLLISLMAYLYSGFKDYPIQPAFIYFQVLINLMMWVNYFFSKRLLTLLSRSKRHYLVQFTRLASLLVICIAVLPAGLYTWYAHNQEITQSIKKEQLYLAESLQKRNEQTTSTIKEGNILNPPGSYFEKINYHSGIYKIYKDSIIENAFRPSLKPKNYSYEKFYFGIANDIGNNYYDPLLLPALQDSVKDDAWFWLRSDTTLSFWYNLTPNRVVDTTTNRNLNKSLNIISAYPDRYKFAKFNISGLFLLLFVLFLLSGLFWLLHSLTERIFLKKYIVITEKSERIKNKIADLFREYNTLNNNAYGGLEKDILALQKEYDVYIPGESDAEIHHKEKLMIDTIEKLRGFYEFVWQKCPANERYLLLDFAKDGLANYKNTVVIYHLLEMGVFIIHDEEIKLFSASFRAYLLTKNDTEEINELQETFRQNSTWQSFRRPLLFILLGIALFIFFTQEQTFQKIIALVAGLSSVSSLLVKFFVDGSSGAAIKK